MHRAVARRARAALVRALALGLQGSIEHAEFFATHSGEVAGGVLRGTRTGRDHRAPEAPYTLNLLVPAPFRKTG
jgi:hypothetical protein